MGKESRNKYVRIRMVVNSAQSNGSRQIVYVSVVLRLDTNSLKLGSSRTVRGLGPQFVKILLTEKRIANTRWVRGGGVNPITQPITLRFRLCSVFIHSVSLRL